MGIGAWWEALTGLQQVFAIAAIPATVILILQTVLSLFGLGHGTDGDASDMDTDVDADVDADVDTDVDTDTGADDLSDVDGLRLLTVRGIIAFFAVGGWLGVVLVDVGVNTALSIVGAVLGGCLAAFLIALFFKLIYKLQSNGNIDVKNAIGKKATVYLTIPASGTSTGKITMELQDRYVELEAKTKQDSPIKTGSTVKIIDVIDGGTVLVEKLTEE